MNKFFTTLFLLCFSFAAVSQELAGDWTGAIEMNGNKLDINFTITRTGESFEATMDIPAQGLKGARAASTTFSGGRLSLSFPKFQIKYEGELSSREELSGNLIQAGHPVPLDLKKGTIMIHRPQEPASPFSYRSEIVTFPTTDDLTLEGSLTLPQAKDPFPLVIIISGSGPQNRDGEMFGHKPYWVLADHLTRNGIAVLRFDERGVGNSEGNFDAATIEILSSDVRAAMRYIGDRKDLNISGLGLIGHSIGGIIAPKIASEDSNVAFLVLMAAPGVNGDQLMLSQKAALERGSGINEMQVAQGQAFIKSAYDIIINAGLDDEPLKDSINNFYINKYGALLPAMQREELVAQITGKETIGLLRSRPSTYLSNIKCPVLAINGDKDFQVPSKDNLEAIERHTTAKGNMKVTIAELKGLNHLFQEAKTGLLNEYAQIEQTIAPDALELISDWVKERAK